MCSALVASEDSLVRVLKPDNYICVPGKTFLLGEYVVLDGGPGLILTTPPYFEMRIRKSEDATQVSQAIFHSKSPAALWIEENADFFKKYSLDFFDPHHGKGGFGASGAQFISVYAAKNPLQKSLPWIEELLTHYFRLAGCSGEKILPSGADLVAQVCGEGSAFENAKRPLLNSGKAQFERAPEFTKVNEDANENCNAASIQKRSFRNPSITYWHRLENQLNTLAWSFPNLSYCLLRTGYKHATHEQLKKLPKPVLFEMIQVVQEGYSAFISQDSVTFIDAIKKYAEWMRRAGCLLSSTEELIQFLYHSKLICAAKGCGALGADVVLVLLDTEKLSVFRDWLRDQNFTNTPVQCL